MRRGELLYVQVGVPSGSATRDLDGRRVTLRIRSLSPMSTRLDARWSSGPQTSRLRALGLDHVHRDTTLRLRCAGATCPFDEVSRTFRAPATRIDVARLLRDRVMVAGTVISIRMTHPVRGTRIWRLVVRRDQKPSRTTCFVRPSIAESIGDDCRTVEWGGYRSY